MCCRLQILLLNCAFCVAVYNRFSIIFLLCLTKFLHLLLLHCAFCAAVRNIFCTYCCSIVHLVLQFAIDCAFCVAAWNGFCIYCCYICAFVLHNIFCIYCCYSVHFVLFAVDCAYIVVMTCIWCCSLQLIGYSIRVHCASCAQLDVFWGCNMQPECGEYLFMSIANQMMILWDARMVIWLWTLESFLLSRMVVQC